MAASITGCTAIATLCGSSESCQRWSFSLMNMFNACFKFQIYRNVCAPSYLKEFACTAWTFSWCCEHLMTSTELIFSDKANGVLQCNNHYRPKPQRANLRVPEGTCISISFNCAPTPMAASPCSPARRARKSNHESPPSPASQRQHTQHSQPKNAIFEICKLDKRVRNT